MSQNASTVLMIAPTQFGYNEESAVSNSFQNKPNDPVEIIQAKARREFNSFSRKLQEIGVQVLIIEDDPDSTCPDSIFPNNWFSTHNTGELILYPMAVANRRAERKSTIIDSLIKKYHFALYDLSSYEDQEIYLEGTGSLIFDHDNRVVYAAISPRTHQSLVEELADHLKYEAVCFRSLGKGGELIYHTNVMMCVGDKYIIIGTGTIATEDRGRVYDSLQRSGKSIVEINNDQVYEHFAGNMLQLKNEKGETVLVMSADAFDHLTEDQLENLRLLNNHILTAEIPTIESIGGGSARCMIAEIFPPIR